VVLLLVCSTLIPPSVSAKTSIVFVLPNTAGALYKVRRDTGHRHRLRWMSTVINIIVILIIIIITTTITTIMMMIIIIIITPPPCPLPQALACFTLRDIDFCKIESRPTSPQLFRYLQFKQQQLTLLRGGSGGGDNAVVEEPDLPRFRYCFYLDFLASQVVKRL
jgi:hypothetical protein